MSKRVFMLEFYSFLFELFLLFIIMVLSYYVLFEVVFMNWINDRCRIYYSCCYIYLDIL